MTNWPARPGLTRDACITADRTTIATIGALLLARSLKLPGFYWAPISTIVILLSTINPLTLARQRFAGTAVGAVVGALIASYPRQNWSCTVRAYSSAEFFVRSCVSAAPPASPPPNSALLF